MPRYTGRSWRSAQGTWMITIRLPPLSSTHTSVERRMLVLTRAGSLTSARTGVPVLPGPAEEPKSRVLFRFRSRPAGSARRRSWRRRSRFPRCCGAARPGRVLLQAVVLPVFSRWARSIIGGTSTRRHFDQWLARRRNQLPGSSSPSRMASTMAMAVFRVVKPI